MAEKHNSRHLDIGAELSFEILTGIAKITNHCKAQAALTIRGICCDGLIDFINPRFISQI